MQLDSASSRKVRIASILFTFLELVHTTVVYAIRVVREAITP